ncbi:MAG: CopG family transcriptional regulator [Deltaproteobacteria bacterium]
MRTIQMTLDDQLVQSVDAVVTELKTTRSAFTREALSAAVSRFHVQRLEDQHRKGYEQFPLGKEEFSIWKDEQHWGDA